jgi:hypothetical protein
MSGKFKIMAVAWLRVFYFIAKISAHVALSAATDTCSSPFNTAALAEDH